MKLKADNNGFTLLELIVVIVVASIAATMVYQFVYTSSVKSTTPIFSLGHSIKIHDTIEIITSDYLQNHTSDLAPLQASIGSTEGSEQNNDYGSYRIIENHFIKFVSNSEQAAPAGDPENGKLLKVIIESLSTGERLTVLYHKQ